MKTEVPTATVPPLTPVLDFLRALWQLNHRLEVASSELLRTHGVTAQQRMLLRVVQHLQPVSAGLLARALHVHAGTLSTSLRRLEQRGLVLRQRDDGDARRITVTLTPAGATIAATLEGTVEQAVDSVLRETSDESTTSTLALLHRLSNAMPRRADEAPKP